MSQQELINLDFAMVADVLGDRVDTAADLADELIEPTLTPMSREELIAFIWLQARWHRTREKTAEGTALSANQLPDDQALEKLKRFVRLI